MLAGTGLEKGPIVNVIAKILSRIHYANKLSCEVETTHTDLM